MGRNIMLTKGRLVEAVKDYREKRRLCKIGLFLYAHDYFNPNTHLYYELNSFIQKDLANVKLSDQLDDDETNKIRLILAHNADKVDGSLSTNGDISDLYEAVSKMVFVIDPLLIKEDHFKDGVRHVSETKIKPK